MLTVWPCLLVALLGAHIDVGKMCIGLRFKILQLMGLENGDSGSGPMLGQHTIRPMLLAPMITVSLVG